MIIIECQNGDIVEVNLVFDYGSKVYGSRPGVEDANNDILIGTFESEQAAKEVKKEIFACIKESQSRIITDGLGKYISHIGPSKAIYSLRKDHKHEN